MSNEDGGRGSVHPCMESSNGSGSRKTKARAIVPIFSSRGSDTTGCIFQDRNPLRLPVFLFRPRGHRDGTLGGGTKILGFGGSGTSEGEKNEYALGPTPEKSRRSVTSACQLLGSQGLSGTGCAGAEPLGKRSLGGTRERSPLQPKR